MIEDIRRRHQALSSEETIEGVAGIAAPVFDRTGTLLAGLVIGPASRALSKIPMLEARVRAAAAEISSLMGYR
jgi:DNA-binding IclR family transcriptional regulator